MKKTGKILSCKTCGKKIYVPGKRLRSFRYCSYKCTGIAKRGIIPKRAFQKNEARITGQNNYQWKGNDASYVAKHRWIKKWFGEPTHCELCEIKGKKYQWANISGTYKRERFDWKQLCISCHRKFDNHGDKSRKTWYKNHQNYGFDLAQ